MPDPTKLRATVPGDATEVATLVRTAFAVQPVVTDPPASALRFESADVRAHLTAGGGGAVAFRGERLVGTAVWSEQDGGLYVARVAVDPAHRRQGIAGMLLAAAETAARARSLPRLHLGTRLALRRNRALFAGYGFVEVGLHAHPGYAEPTWVEMEKRL
jgi:ribosomal protein S18 acetylase RimI-like enzyme